ncbi:MAG: flagellar biosynthesis anti-sigma factor FlgM [Thermodesulfobacteriota bacterium]|nr:flagellar biosynthesis anti-sigma factor FlgM [Thermodesulfobacteriota bacterium]
MNRPGAGGKKGNGSGIDRKSSIRRKRVELLKEKVERGTYRVDPMKLAEKLIENAVRRIRSRDGSK